MNDTVLEVSAVDQLKMLKKQKMAEVEKRDRLIRLYRNPDFKAMILQEYMVMEVARFMEAAGNPTLGPVQRADALAGAYAPGMLKRWLDARLMMGDSAQEQLAQIDDQILDIEHEEMEEAISGETSVAFSLESDDDEEDDGV